jgi:acyl dehydratase
MTAVTRIDAGTELPPLTVEPISRATLALFAGASGDHNPIHIDLDVARSAGADDVFAHGMLSMAYLGRLLTNWVPQERLRSWRVRFAAIAPVRAQPTCTGRVLAVTDGLAALELQVTVPDGTVILTGDAVIDLTLLGRRGPGRGARCRLFPTGRNEERPPSNDSPLRCQMSSPPAQRTVWPLM